MRSDDLAIEAQRDICGMNLGETSKQAAELVRRHRNDEYDDPTRNFQRISNIFFNLSGIRLTPCDIALLQVATKLGRNIHKHKDDNIIDAAGYLDIYNYLESRQNEQ